MQQFSLTRWQILTEQAQKNITQGYYPKAEVLYKQALCEAQKLIDDLSLSAHYVHSARLYMTACYNLIRTYQYQNKIDKAFQCQQLAHVQLQKFAGQDLLTEETRIFSLKVLDGALVALLEYYQVHQDSYSKKKSASLISEHIAFMATFNNQNLPEDLQSDGEKNQHNNEDITLH